VTPFGEQVSDEIAGSYNRGEQTVVGDRFSLDLVCLSFRPSGDIL